MLPRLHLDWETRSTVDIRNTGMHVYCEHPSTSIWLCRYRFEGDTAVGEWRRGQPFPERLLKHVLHGGVVVAHNAGFERTVWNAVLPRQLGYAVPLMTIEQQDCTMARAYAMGLPGSLELVAKIVDAPVQKDMTGSANMKRMAKPRRVNPDGTIVWWDDLERIQNLSDYCRDDVLAEEGVDDVLPALSKDDRETWVMDQRMNERGIHLDIHFAARAWDVVEVARGRLDKKMCALTGGVVSACSRRQALVEWLNDRGHSVTSLAKGAIEEVQAAIAARSDVLAKRAVELYVQGNKTSTSKLKKVQETVCADGRSRGTVQCHGAFTGRWSGRLWQPQNLKRLADDDGPVIRLATAIILQYAPEKACDILEAAFADVIETISLCMRSVVCAEDGHELIGADYSNIEGRLIAWLAGATLKLEAFAAQDRKEGYDLYNLSYAKSFGIDVSTMPKKSFMRQIGKVQELACIAEGQRVLTDHGLLAIEDVQKSHKVWDGVEFVSHDGVVFRGVRECIEWDGLIATPDHLVWAGELGQVAFGYAASRKTRLTVSGNRGSPIRVGEDHISRKTLERELEGCLCGGSMHRLSARRMDRARGADPWEIERLPELFATASCSEMAGEALLSSKTEMHQPERRGLPELGCEGCEVSVRLSNGNGRMGGSEPRTGERQTARPDRQQRPLRTREHSLGVSQGEYGELQTRGARKTYDIRLAGPRNRFTVEGRLVHNCGYQGSVGAYVNMAANYRIKPEEIAELVLKNCTQDDYDKAAWAYRQPGVNHFDLDREVWIGLKIVVNLWRASPLNADVAQFWWDLQDAALEAVTNPGRVVYVGKTGKIAYVVSNGFMWCRLPTGKCLPYCNPRVRTKTTLRARDDGAEYEQITRSVEYDGWDGEKKKWGTIHLYGGLQANHVTQGTAAEIMKRGMKNLEAGASLWGGNLVEQTMLQRQLRPQPFANILTVHDEAMSEVKEAENDAQRDDLICIFETLMLDVGPEFTGLPLAASGWMDKRYVK